MRRVGVRFVVTLAGLGLLVAGCTSGSPSAQSSHSPKPSSSGSSGPSGSASGSASASASAKAPDLKSQLLQIGDMPAGWTVDTADSATNSGFGCLTSAEGKIKGANFATVTYAGGASLPLVTEDLSWAGSAKSAADTYAAAKSVIDKCSSPSLALKKKSLTGRLGAMSFPTEGANLSAWNVVFTGSTVGFDTVLIQQGSDVILLGYEYGSAPNTAALETFSRIALQRTGTS